MECCLDRVSVSGSILFPFAGHIHNTLTSPLIGLLHHLNAWELSPLLYVSVGLIVGDAGRAGKSFTQVNVHHGRTFCTLGPSTSLPYFHKLDDVLSLHG